MPAPLMQDVKASWLPGTTGIVGGSGPGGLRRVRIQDGERTLPGEDRDQVLPYVGKRIYGRVLFKAGPHPYGYPERYTYVPSPLDGFLGPVASDDYPPENAEALNKAYSKFIESWSAVQGQLGASLLESAEIPGAVKSLTSSIKGGFKTIERASLKMAKAYRALRRGNLHGMCSTLGVSMKRKHRRSYHNARKRNRVSQWTRDVAHNASSYWLQYWFGWSPLASEVFNTVEILTSSKFAENLWIKNVGKSGYAGSHRDRYFTGDDYLRTCDVDYKVRVRVGAELRIVNPNVKNLTDLGLTNPVSWLWELVPFSFVVDWFTNVGQVIDSYTDLWGSDIRRAYYTTFLRGTARATYGNPGIASPCIVEWRYFKQWRSVGMYKPILLKPSLLRFGHSLTRAATAVSLLIALFVGR